MWDDVTIDGLRDCPEAALRWAAIAYRAGVQDARTMLLADLAEVRPTAAVRRTLRRPRFDELGEIRSRADFTPCPRRCRACSRCIASEAHWARGGRDFLGVAAERRLAEQLAEAA